MKKGIIIADTKFEFGIKDDKVILIDEVLTPDSSRFWPKDSYATGQSQMSFDKQFVRDYLEGIGWDKNPPAPALPKDIVEKPPKNTWRLTISLPERGCERDCQKGVFPVLAFRDQHNPSFRPF